MTTPRVLVLTSTLPARDGDGTPAFVADLSRELGQEFRVRILAPAVPGAPRTERWSDSVDVVRYRYFPARWEDLAAGAILENVRARRSRLLQVPFLLAGLHRELRRQVRDFDPQAIHAHWIIPQGVVARRTSMRIPTVVTTLGGDLYALESRPLRAAKARVVRAAAAVTVMNSDMRSRAIALGADPERTFVMPMGARFEAELGASELGGAEPGGAGVGGAGLSDAEFGGVGSDVPEAGGRPAEAATPLRLLAVGRLVEKKGFDVLLAAVRDLSVRVAVPVDVVIVGDGPERDTLARMADGLPVTFLGMLGREELAQRYREADIAVFPSRRAASGDQDGLPVAMLEAMGAGCAVVASDLPGLNEAIVPGISGLLAAPGEPESLAQAIESLAGDPQRRRTLGEAAAHRAQDYSVAAVGARYRELFTGIVTPQIRNSARS